MKHRDPRDVVGRLIGMVHKPLKYQVRPVRGPGAPGELFVEGERFNVQRVYENLTNGFVLSLGEGRLFTPDVPFEPFSIRNRLMASPPWTQSPIGSTGGTIGGNPLKSIPFWFPVSGQSVAQAERTIAANPQNAAGNFQTAPGQPLESGDPARSLVSDGKPGDWSPIARSLLQPYGRVREAGPGPAGKPE